MKRLLIIAGIVLLVTTLAGALTHFDKLHISRQADKAENAATATCTTFTNTKITSTPFFTGGGDFQDTLRVINTADSTDTAWIFWLDDTLWVKTNGDSVWIPSLVGYLDNVYSDTINAIGDTAADARDTALTRPDSSKISLFLIGDDTIYGLPLHVRADTNCQLWVTAETLFIASTAGAGGGVTAGDVHDSCDATRGDAADSARAIVEDSLDNYPLTSTVLKKDGSVALTGNWNAGAFEIRTSEHFDVDGYDGIYDTVRVVTNVQVSGMTLQAKYVYEIFRGGILVSVSAESGWTNAPLP